MALLFSTDFVVLVVSLLFLAKGAWTFSPLLRRTTTTTITTLPTVAAEESCSMPSFHRSSLSAASSSTATEDDDYDDDDEHDIVIQPTVMVNGQDQAESSTTTTRNDEDAIATAKRNQEIMGATAAMAIKIETPLETTLKYVSTALLDLELISPIQDLGEATTTATTATTATKYVTATPETIASLVQGKRVALYFAAGWCPMCREFEFMMPQYSKALQESAQPIQLIYVSSDASLEFQLDRMLKLGMRLGVPPTVANTLKAKYGIWAGREAQDFALCGTKRRSGVPALIVLDTQGQELAFLDTESETIAAMADWPLDDPKGIF